MVWSTTYSQSLLLQHAIAYRNFIMLQLVTLIISTQVSNAVVSHLQQIPVMLH